MFRLLIFGGTTEGRELAEYCADNSINADISVTTEYGASLLPHSSRVLCGRLDVSQMSELIQRSSYDVVIDATHPYAVEATQNIREACDAKHIRYLRLLRKKGDLYGTTVNNLAELITLLNATDSDILSTLGSKTLKEMTSVRNYKDRLWIRVLPSDEILEQCRRLGFCTSRVIAEKGPFSVEQNIAHLKKSGAKILVTKESGDAGGYAEKVEAARYFGVDIITLARPAENGYSFEEVIEIIEKELKK